MNQIQAGLNLAKDLEQVGAVAGGAGWDVSSPDKLTVEISIRSSVDGERYSLHFRCTDYPDQPPSIVCFDKASGSHQVRSAWPQCQGFRADSSWDLCLPLSAEGFKVHPEWQNDPQKRWNSNGNPLLRVIDEIQLRLNDPTKYSGRLQ